jgi:hypothetical protein
MRTPALRLVAAALMLSACSAGGDKPQRGAQVSFSGDSASAIVLGPGDVQITSTGGGIVLAVIGDSVRMQLSDSLRAHVRRELDSSGGDSRLAGAILRSVGTVVNSAMGFVVQVHVDDVEDLRYEDGNIRFDVRGGRVRLQSGRHTANDAAFRAEDAQRFIDTVKRRQSAPRIAQ